MVDKYDDRDSVQTEEGLIDEGQEYNDQTEVWQEGQTPVDDFSDESPSGQEGMEEIVEEEGEAVTEEALPKRNSMWLPVIAGVVGVLFVGTMLYAQYGSGDTSGSGGRPLPEIMRNNDGSKTPSVPEASATTNSKYSSDAGNASSAQSGTTAAFGTAVATDPTVMERSTLSEPMTTMAAAPEMQSPPPVATPMPVPTPVPAQNVSSPTAMPMAPAVVAAQAVPVPAPSAASSDAQVSNLASRLDEMQKSLAQLTLQIGQISSTVANLQAASPQAVPVVASPEVSDRLMRLEQQISSLATRAISVESTKESPAKTAPAPKSVSADIYATEGLSVSDVSSEKIKKPSKSVKKSSRKSVATTRSSSREEKVSSKGKWVLRAATPDMAWVSKSNDSEELRQVEIGQTLPGIGKVRSIRETAKGWEIVGASGTLR